MFGSERALARYLADEHEHDLSDLSTYDDIRTAATDGSLDVKVTEENVYVLTRSGRRHRRRPRRHRPRPARLAVELLRDVSDYSEDDTVDEALAADRRWAGSSTTCSTTSRLPARRAVRRGRHRMREAGTFVESRLRTE